MTSRLRLRCGRAGFSRARAGSRVGTGIRGIQVTHAQRDGQIMDGWTKKINSLAIFTNGEK